MSNWLGAAIGAVGSLFGQSSANSSNKSIMREQNAFNAAEAQKSRDFALEMWNKTNEYNSPSAQRQRMEEAGLNPFLSDVSTGSASTADTSAQASAASSPSMQSVVPDFSSVASAIASMAQARKVATETESTAIYNRIAEPLLNAQLQQTYGNTDYKNLAVRDSKYWNRETGWISQDIDQSREKQELQNARYSARLIQAQEASILLDSKAKSILNKYMDEQQQADLLVKAQTLVNMRADVGYKGAMSDAALARAKSDLAQAVLTSAQTKGQRISNSIAEETAESLIRASIQSNELSSITSDESKKYARRDVQSKSSKLSSESKEAHKSQKTRYWRDFSQVISNVGNAVGNFIKFW